MVTKNHEGQSPEAWRQMLHDMEVRQIELETQNENLRRTQSELEATRSLHLDFYDQAPVGYFTLNEWGVILQANVTAAKMLGVTDGALLKQALSRFVFSEDQDIFHQLCHQLIVAPEPQLFELRVARPDGATFWAQLSGTAVQGENNVREMRIVLSDITVRKQSEEALKQERFLLKALMNNVPEHVYFKDCDSRIIRISQAQARLFGLSDPDQAVGKTDFDFFSEEHAQQAYQDEQAVMRTGQPLTMEERETWANQPDTWVSTTKMPLRDEKGNIVGTFGISRDITKSRQAEDELRIAATAFESQEGMFVTDASRMILRVNNTFTKITGYTALEAVGQDPRLLASGHHDAAFFAAMWGTIMLTGAWQGEIWNRRKNGEMFPQWLTITAVNDDSGLPTHYVATFTDITERKQIENQVHQLAYYDVLTKLPNRRLLYDRLSQTMASSKRSSNHCALLFLDLDNFKPLNDTHGHVAGDFLLIEAALRLKSCVREVDTVARFGGDEFVVILSDLNSTKAKSASQAERVAEKIRTRLSAPYYLSVRKEGQADTRIEHHCTASIGVVMFNDHEASPDNIIRWADTAMYQAKETGRNLVRFYAAEV